MERMTISGKAVAASILFLLAPAAMADMQVTEAAAKEAAVAKTPPEYPAMARQLKITGKVELEVTIATAGTVEDVRIVSGNPVLTKSCAKAVAEWKFRPFLEDGKPARAKAPLSFEFK